MIDLHTHSTFSDGTLTPEELVIEAVNKQISAIALTDHDTVLGINDFLIACKKHKIKGIPGIEISVNDELERGGQIHILGLFINHKSTLLDEYSNKMRDFRIERNSKILDKLNDLKIAITVNDVLAESSDGILGRVHIARALIKINAVKSVNEAFEKYIGPGKPAFIPKPRFTTKEMIEFIHKIGGIAILAHPIYLNLPLPELSIFIKKLAQDGLDGVEIFYPNTPKKLEKKLLQIVHEEKLLVSGGSDFHGSLVRPEISLGSGNSDIYVPDRILFEMDEYIKNRDNIF